MQTPPPTSTSASRRKAQQAQVARLAKDGVSTQSRRMSSPATAQNNPQHPHNTLLEESPLQFPNLQISPDGLSFPTGPATAPVYPQHKLFWDPDESSNIMNMEMSMDDSLNAFGITTSNPFFSDQNDNVHPFSTSTSSNALQQTTGMIQSSHAAALNQTNMSSSTAIITQGSSSVKNRGTLVNPSLLFSSPSRAPDLASSAFSQAPQDESMQPYAQQVRDAQLEKEIKARKQKRKRPPELGESPAVTAATAALRDDSTNSSKSSPVIADSFFGALENGPPQLPSRKRMTPDNHYQKHGGQATLSRRRSSKKAQPAVTLKIDGSGRAVTETSFVKGLSGNAMDVDSESDDSDSSSVSEGRMVPSQQKAFNQRKASQGRRARFADDPHTHSQRPSDASTLASGRSGSRMQGSLSMNAGHAHVHFPSSQSLAAQDDDSEVSTIVDSDEDRGDAQSELRKVVRQRSFGKKANNRASWSAVYQNKPDRRPSHAGAGASGPSPYYVTHNGAASGTYPDLPGNSSPTTITDPDLTTPSTGGSGLGKVNGATRCVCGTVDGNGQLMIQWYVTSHQPSLFLDLTTLCHPFCSFCLRFTLISSFSAP